MMLWNTNVGTKESLKLFAASYKTVRTQLETVNLKLQPACSLVVHNTDHIFTKRIFINVVTAYNDGFVFSIIANKPVVKIKTRYVKIGAGFIEQQERNIRKNSLGKFNTLLHS
jgi:hypothetical protein